MSLDPGGHPRQVAAEARGFREAARRFFPVGHRLVETPAVSPGYSGSAFASVEAGCYVWVLRRWPPGFGEGRLRFIHRVLLHSRRSGFMGVPELALTPTGGSVVRIADKLYDAQTLLGGEPLVARTSSQGPSSPNVAGGISSERLTALAAALARFHLSTAGLSPRPEYRVFPLTNRLNDLEDAIRGRLGELLRARRIRTTNEEHEIAQQWLALLPRALDGANRAVERLPAGGTSEVLCHADLWPAHVRFEDDLLVGFADFESLTFASPGLDLAHLVGHFGGWNNTNAVLRAYRTVAPLTEADESYLAPEVVVDLAAEGLWALEELYGDFPGLNSAQEAAHRLNLIRLIGSLEQATTSCEGPER